MTGIVEHYLREMVTSIGKVEDSEATYRKVVAEYQAGHGETVTADYLAADDPRLRTAIGDGAFYRSRATMYACAATAAMLDERRQRGAL